LRLEHEMDKHDDLGNVRRDKVFEDINLIVDSLQNLNVFPSLVWVYTWDIVKERLDYYSPESGEYYVTNSKLTEKDVWDLFWEDADKNGFSLEYGTEDLHEAVFDWMVARDIIIDLEEAEDE
jgi:hypothetical protein